MITHRHLRLIVPLALLLLLAGCDSREKIVVYSPHGAEMLGDYEKLFEQAHPEIDLQWLDMGANEVYSRVRSEQARPAADVWWGAPSTMFMQAAEEGLLAVYEPSWADAVDDAYHDPQHRWYATYRSPLAILFNMRARSAEEVPQTWDELLAPEWEGKIALRKLPPSGTMRTFIAAMVTRAPSEDAGFEWLRKLHENTAAYPESPYLLYDHLKKHDERISVWLMPDIILQRERNDFPFGFYLPPETPVLTDGIAIIENAPHPNHARTFYEFVTTQEALIQQAEAYAKLPAREDIQREKLPRELVSQDIAPLPMDWGHVSEKMDEWTQRWETEVYEGDA